MESAADVQHACRELVPGYSLTSREEQRWAVLTRACLIRRPVDRTGEPAPSAADGFDDFALRLLVEPDADLGSLVIGDVERASDMLCALWLCRRSGLFIPASTARGSAGSRSRLGLVPSFKPASVRDATYTLATLYANAAYKRHLAARGNSQPVAIDADGDVHERLARQARSWGVELSA